MKKFCYIILHYKNIKDTLECIRSIQKNCNKESKIIIVDNSTLNQEDEKKIKNYEVDLIKLDKNYGFAKGNNKGCSYAIAKYQPDYLVVINNDILITKNNFESTIIEVDKNKEFDMLGPKIITDNGESVNPFPVYDSLKSVDKGIKKSKILIKIYKNVFLRYLLEKYIGIKRKFIKPKHLTNGEVFQENIALHGCAIVFSKKYYQKYTHVFYNDTFLYHEEEFLFYRIKRDSLISCYCPKLEVFHKEGASLNNSYTNEYKKLIFRNEEIVKSLTKLKKVMITNKKI